MLLSREEKKKKETFKGVLPLIEAQSAANIKRQSKWRERSKKKKRRRRRRKGYPGGEGAMKKWKGSEKTKR